MNVTQTEEILRSAVQTVTVMEEIREVQTETVRQIIAAGHQQQVLQEEAEETVLRKAAEEPRAAAVQRTATIRTEGILDLQAGHIMTTGMTMMPTESVLILIIRKHQMHMEILKKQQRKRQLDIENMADFEEDEFEQLRDHEDSKISRDLLKDLDPDDYDEWEDN